MGNNSNREYFTLALRGFLLLGFIVQVAVLQRASDILKTGLLIKKNVLPLTIHVLREKYAKLVVPENNGVCANWSSDPTSKVGECTKSGKLLWCHGGVANLQVISVPKMRKLEELVLCSWPNVSFDPITLMSFPKLKILKIEQSNLTHIYHDFPDMYHLEVVNISWTKLSHITPTLFHKVHNLKYLDLRWNRFKFFEGPLELPNLSALYLTGNPWNCTKNLKWLLNTEKSYQVEDRNILKCMDQKYFGKHLLTVMHYKIILKQECQNHPEIRNCSCSMHYIRKTEDGKSLTPIYAINCSNLNLISFPSYLPENTTIFYANGNQISDVRPLRNNIAYRTVTDVYLDYNQIQTVDVLEAGYWLRHFRVLSLKANKLTRLPVYALDNALENNHNAVKLQLSLNPWICDCKFTMRFREILMKYHAIIKDSDNITCKYIEGDDNFLAQVLSLNRGDVCKLPAEFKIQPLDLLSGILSCLIVFVLGKLAYDYYHFRRTGRLPWIVTKIP